MKDVLNDNYDRAIKLVKSQVYDANTCILQLSNTGMSVLRWTLEIKNENLRKNQKRLINAHLVVENQMGICLRILFVNACSQWSNASG